MNKNALHPPSTNPRGLNGWLVLDPGRWPYAWYGHTLADDAGAAMALLEPNDAAREQMRRSGWSVRAGNATELTRPVGIGLRSTKAARQGSKASA